MQNGHPLVVHFPVALLTVATLATLVGAFVRAGWLAPFARVSLYVGTLGAAFAVVSGFFAAQTVAKVAAAAHALGEHQTYGYIILGLACALTAWSVVAWRRTASPPRPAAVWWIANAALLAVLVLGAKEGGELVHEYGVGTALTGPKGPLHETPAPGDAGRKPGTPSESDSVPTAKDFR